MAVPTLVIKRRWLHVKVLTFIVLYFNIQLMNKNVLLNQRYEIKATLGQRGFATTYLVKTMNFISFAYLHERKS